MVPCETCRVESLRYVRLSLPDIYRDDHFRSNRVRTTRHITPRGSSLAEPQPAMRRTGFVNLSSRSGKGGRDPRALKSRGRILGKLSDFAPGDKPGGELFAIE